MVGIMRRMRALAFLSLLGWGCDEPEIAAAEPTAPTPPVVPAAASAATPPNASPSPVPHFATAERVDTTIDGKGEGPYRFTADWHINAMSTWSEQLAELRGRPGLRYLEIGVFEGRSLLWMLDEVLTDPSSRATAIDVFMGDYEQAFDANLRASGWAERVTKIKGPSQKELRSLPEASFDIIYIDGSHTAADVLADAVLSWDLLVEGGLLIFDDYRWTGRPSGGQLPTELLPQLAIDAFVTAHRNSLELRHRDYQVFLRKLANPCAVKDYCSPIGQYNYFWRSFELRRRDDTVVELTEQERALIELIGRSKKIGDVGFTLDPRFRAAPEVVALTERLQLEL
jgi:predicted O-methyltransferase YrrM